MDQTAVEVWYGYRSKFNIKYILPSYLFVSLNNRGSDGWNPDAGTGYPYSGQAYSYVPSNQSLDVFQSTTLNLSGYPGMLSGVSNVNTAEDTSPSATSIYVFISGTVNPYQSSSWYQWTSGGVGRASAPNNQISAGQIMASGIGVSGNPLYNYTSNENLSSFQFTKSAGQTISGTFSANVPTSESSWNV